MLALCVTACGAPAADESSPAGESSAAQATSDAPPFSPRVKKYSLPLSGLTREYRLLLVNDLHLIAENDPQVNEVDRATVAVRREAFRGPHGTADLYWEKLAPVLDNADADLIVFAGDMVDYASEQNLTLLRAGLSRIKTPFVYLRADHDTGRWYTDEHMPAEDVTRLHEEMGDNSVLHVWDLGEMTVVGWNNSTSKMTQTQADMLKLLSETTDPAKPMVFITHVPLRPEADERLLELSMDDFDGRSLLWGSDCYHTPDDITAGALSLIYENKLPVSHVFAGHLHFAYDGPLTAHCEQHVLAPAFEDNITIVEFIPEE